MKSCLAILKFISFVLEISFILFGTASPVFILNGRWSFCRATRPDEKQARVK
jgi:hypothetical protein